MSEEKRERTGNELPEPFATLLKEGGETDVAIYLNELTKIMENGGLRDCPLHFESKEGSDLFLRIILGIGKEAFLLGFKSALSRVQFGEDVKFEYVPCDAESMN